MSAPSTVVICHGSYHTPVPYQPFLDALKGNNIEAYCPQLPASDHTKLNVSDISHPNYDIAPPPGGFPQPPDDIEVIKKLLHRLVVNEGKNVLLIGHSSGAFTTTASAIPALQAQQGKAQDASGGIIGIFYACGFLIPFG